ncbi:PKD domain-containing protein [Chitinophagaceae bacterium LB-8]|uniref:PKD domain-containing protein n=1 Tax=Paraflavisolibacter caeni TaxID=2982496 RepID=A0A9X3BH30_9BACT|nr:PKD domain-containing protein [Paraflavisolibacter caeni]MCU7548857.1 PKD domain-containing protein [Paraflavisolibacter caeni]
MGFLATVQRRLFLLILVILVSNTNAFCQLKAAFTASPVSGCAPIVVQFTDESTGNPTQWQWDLGNGVISYLQNPSVTYFTPGTYKIKLVVRSADAEDVLIKDQYVTVYPNPAVDFNASDTMGCFPLSVQFKDLSTTSSGTLTNWSWDFGDGITSQDPDPIHTYLDAGDYSVTLRVTNSFGCQKILKKTQYIKIGDGVDADFSNNSPGICGAPVSLQFTNQSSGPGSLTYQWDFGDGIRSTDRNPQHTYTTGGTYNVSLVTVSSKGCRDTMLKENLVSVGTVSSDFNLPDTVCAGQTFSLTNASSPEPGLVTWNFGDGTISESFIPVKKYSGPGTYKIKLVNNFGGCLDSITKSIIVTPNPKPSFTAPLVSGCIAPFTVKFTNNTSGNNTYKWFFGDGTSSTDRQPEHTYKDTGRYTVTLISFNENGCSDTTVMDQFIKVLKPTAIVSNVLKSGCLPLEFSPMATVVSSEPVTSYLWKFGDGTTSNDVHPSHIFTTAGKFDITLIVATQSGCADTVVIKEAVKTAEKAKANFSVNPKLVCARDPATFTDNSTSTGIIDEWFWKFGDGTTSTQQNPVHEYQDTGWFSVTLIVNGKTCPDTITIDDVVYIKPPIPSFSFINSCDDKFTKNFTDKSVGALTWEWTFGDGSGSKERNPSHTYASPGNYSVKLDISNGSCTHTTAQIVRVINEKAAFSLDPAIVCKGSPVNFKGKDFNIANISKMEWNFGDGSNAIGAINIAHTYSKAGKYVPSLTITDLLGCSDTTTAPVSVYGPTADFYPNVEGACLGSSLILFADSSKTDGINEVVKRIWNFGDDSIDSTSGAPYKHLYTKAGEYTVTFKVVDSYGCTDVISKPKVVTIAQPKADFISFDSSSCTGKPVRFINRSIGYNLTSQWSFGDSSFSDQLNPIYSYKDTGLYSIKLVVTDKYGCKDSLLKNEYIKITYPRVSFLVSDTFATCPPLLVNFTNTSVNYTTIKWNFDDGDLSTFGSPSHYYTYPGVYNASLTVTSPGGCVETKIQKIVVKGPTGTLEYPEQIGCNPHTVTLTAHTLNNISFIWDYSDGSTLATIDSVVKHTYTQIGSYVPRMILIDDAGCKVPVQGKDTIKVVDVIAKFGLDNFKFCDSGYVRFSDSSSSVEPLKSWEWSFGDGKFSNEQNPVYHYKNPGSFTAQLITTSKTGCKDTAVINKKIDVFESPIIDIAGDLESCKPGKFLFKGKVIRGDSMVLKWTWDFGNRNTSTVQYPAEQVYTEDKTYLLTASVTDDHNCKSINTKEVVIHPLPIVDAGPDILICRGDSVQLKGSGAVTYGWSTAKELTCYNCASPKASPIDTTIYEVTGYNQFGCLDIDSVKVVVRQRFEIDAGPNDSVCVGNSVLLSAWGADSFSWYPATGLDNPNIHNPKARPLTSTLYTVVGRDIDKCFTDTATVFIKVNPYPKVDAGPDVTIPVGNSVQIKPVSSTDVVSWQWTPPYNLSCLHCETTNATPRRNTKYTVTVKNISGCTSTDYMTVSLVCNSGNLFIPNTFSPNNDGSNDKFYPRGTGISLVRSLRVFNRWGELVFERMNFNANDDKLGWDGIYKGQLLTSDVYVYTCEVICDNMEVLSYTGDIALIR